VDKELKNMESFNENQETEIQDEFSFLDNQINKQSQNIQENFEKENSLEITEKDDCNIDNLASKPDDLIVVRPVKFQEFTPGEANRTIKKNLDILQDIDMHVSVELGKSKLSIKEVMDMEKGSIVQLDKIAGEQVEIYVNQKLVARGEVIVIEDKFGVRVVSTNLPKPTI